MKLSAEMMIVIIIAGTIFGLIMTADSDPELPKKPEQYEETNLVDKIPNNENHTKTTIKYPFR